MRGDKLFLELAGIDSPIADVVDGGSPQIGQALGIKVAVLSRLIDRLIDRMIKTDITAVNMRTAIGMTKPILIAGRITASGEYPAAMKPVPPVSSGSGSNMSPAISPMVA